MVRTTLTVASGLIPSRRTLLLRGGQAALSASAVALLAGCGSMAGTRSANADSMANDADILNTALGLEYEGIAAYQVGAESGLLSKPVLDVAVTFQGHHKEHADVLAATVRKLGGTPVARKLQHRHAEGVHVGGTSAGAAILAEHMIGGGMAGATPRGAGVVLAPGLGFTRRLVIDQHFRQRDRLGRLLAALSYNPQAVGVGIDEDTALFLGPDERFEVVGSGAVTVAACAWPRRIATRASGRVERIVSVPSCAHAGLSSPSRSRMGTSSAAARSASSV